MQVTTLIKSRRPVHKSRRRFIDTENQPIPQKTHAKVPEKSDISTRVVFHDITNQAKQVKKKIPVIVIDDDDFVIQKVEPSLKKTESKKPESTPKQSPKEQKPANSKESEESKETGFQYDKESDCYTLSEKRFQLSNSIYSKLYPYQREGVEWLWKRFNDSNIRGGILADDMGLGKTIQVSSFLSGMFQSKLIKHVMILAPVSVLVNWKNELGQWAKNVRLFFYHNMSKQLRKEQLKKFSQKGGIMLTSYGMIVSQNEQLVDAKLPLDYIILDEGHKIKNPKIKLSKCLRQLQSTHKLILSGTPIQNNLMEMWALCDYVFDGKLLGTSVEFKEKYERKIVKSTKKDATKYEKHIGNVLSNKLRTLLEPYMLRREKSGIVKSSCDVDQLERMEALKDCPKKENLVLGQKNDFVIWLPLTKNQEEMYRDFLGSEEVGDVLKRRTSALSAITILKQISTHPLLLGDKGGFDLKRINEKNSLEWSCKLQFIRKLLINLKQNNHRTLLFSQSTKLLDIVQQMIEQDLKQKCCRIDGTISSASVRQEIIEKFNKDTSIETFLLTSQTGSLGLTLTGADRVIIIDPAWNPTVDNQAVDRAYRIGQKKNVIVYRLITCGTIEEKIYRKQVFKGGLSKTTIKKENQYRYFSDAELHALFTMEDTRASKTQQQLAAVHEKKRRVYPALAEHLKELNEMEICGISDHDLLFQEKAVDDLANAEIEAEIYAKQFSAQRFRNSFGMNQRRTFHPYAPMMPKRTVTRPVAPAVQILPAYRPVMNVPQMSLSQQQISALSNYFKQLNLNVPNFATAHFRF